MPDAALTADRILLAHAMHADFSPDGRSWRPSVSSLFVRHLLGACIMTRVSRTVKMLVWTARTTAGLGLLSAGIGSLAFDTPATQEIDAASAASAMALLTGGVMLLRDWLRTK
jgi:hypothetical protein